MQRLCIAALLATSLFLVPGTQAQQSAPTSSPLDFSGYAYGSYNFHIDSAAKASLGGKAPNQFSLDRWYLTFRMPAGDNGAIRVTTDIYQQLIAPANVYYSGWLIKLKYAYFQYTGLRSEERRVGK